MNMKEKVKPWGSLNWKLGPKRRSTPSYTKLLCVKVRCSRQRNQQSWQVFVGGFFQVLRGVEKTTVSNILQALGHRLRDLSPLDIQTNSEASQMGLKASENRCQPLFKFTTYVFFRSASSPWVSGPRAAHSSSSLGGCRLLLHAAAIFRRRECMSCIHRIAL